MSIGTQYFLDGIPLAYTRLKWPLLYRGTQYVPVVFWQPTFMYDKLKNLSREEAGVTLTVRCQGKAEGAYQIDIEGVQIIKVEKMTERERPDGCRVEIADRRWRLQGEIMGQSWSLLFQGNYLDDTAKSKTEAYRLDEALKRHVTNRYPFKGHLRDDFAQPIKPQGNFDFVVPNDLLYAGQPMAPTLQKLLEWWGIDLSVDLDGNFYLANRLGSRSSDPGYSEVKARFAEFEWVETKPQIEDFKQKKDARLPKVFKIPFWERHALQVPHGEFPSKDTTTGNPLPLTEHGLALVEAYKALGRFFAYNNLLRVYGKNPNTITDKPRTYFMQPNLKGTKLSVTERGLDADEREIRFTLATAIQESVRKYYAIVDREDESQKVAWTDFALGVCGGDGVIQPRDAVGDWTELYDKVVVPRSALAFDRGEAYSQLDNGKIPIPIVEVHSRFKEFPGQERSELGVFSEFARKLGRKVGIIRPNLAKTRNQGEAAPFNVTWGAKDIGIIKLDLDKRRVKPGSDALIGAPSTIPELNGPNPNKGLKDDDNDNSKKRRKAVFDAKYKILNLRVRQTRQDLVFPIDYKFFIFITATRNVPNDREKFWVETVPGFPSGDLEEMWLDADPRMPAYRDFVDYSKTGAAEITTIELRRPNGIDQFGKILNRQEIKRRAFARAQLMQLKLAEPASWSHPFLNFPLVRTIGKLKGAIDTIMLDISGKIVKAELSMGTRANTAAVLEESNMRAVRQVTEMGGKKLAR